MADARPIGIFDSGMGGLTLVHALTAILPQESIVYFGDTAHLPYGRKSAAEVQRYSLEIVDFLLSQGAKAIVVACNTATAAAIDLLRETWSEVPIIGMEPAVKPAAQATRSGVVGVLATQGTFLSQRYADLMQRYGKDVEMLENPCLGLVELVEEGKVDGPEGEVLLRGVLDPMLAAGADTFVLGCTHYPFALGQIRQLVGPDAHIINPAPAVARHLKRRLQGQGLLRKEADHPTHTFYASGPSMAMQQAIRDYLHLDTIIEVIRPEEKKI